MKFQRRGITIFATRHETSEICILFSSAKRWKNFKVSMWTFEDQEVKVAAFVMPRSFHEKPTKEAIW